MQNGSAVGRVLLAAKSRLPTFSRCAGNGIDDGSRHSFYLAQPPLPLRCLLILPTVLSCEAGSRGSFAWIPRPQRMRDADDLAFADRSEIPAVERIGMWLEEEELARKKDKTPIPCRQGPAFGIVIKRLGGGFSVDENNTVRSANTVAAERNNPLEKRHPGGSRRWVESRFSRVREGRKTAVSPCSGLRFSMR